MVFSGVSDGKESACDAEDLALGQEDTLKKGMANLIQYSCLENIDRGAWQATVHGVKESGITE